MVSGLSFHYLSQQYWKQIRSFEFFVSRLEKEQKRSWQELLEKIVSSLLHVMSQGLLARDIISQIYYILVRAIFWPNPQNTQKL